MNLNTLINIISPALKKRIGPLHFFRCWYSPRRVPVRHREVVFEDNDIISGSDILPVDNCPTVEAPKLNSVIEQTARKWDEKKEQQHEDFLLPSQKAQREIDNLCKSIEDSKTVEELFNVLKENFSLCNEDQYIIIVTKLAEFSKNGILEVEKLHEMTTFKVVLFYLWKQVRTLTDTEVLHLLDDLTTLKVETKSLIFQSLLQIIKYKINYMDVTLLMKLNAILSCHSHIPVVVALRKAIIPMMNNEVQKPIGNLHIDVALKVIEYCKANDINIDIFLDDIKVIQLEDADKDLEYGILYLYLKTLLLPASNKKVKTEVYNSTVNFLLKSMMNNSGHFVAGMESQLEELLPQLREGLCVPLSEEAVKFLDEIYVVSRHRKPWQFDEMIAFGKNYLTMGYINKDIVDDICKCIISDGKTVSIDDLLWIHSAIFASSSKNDTEFMDYFTSTIDFSNIEYKSEWLQTALILLLKNKCPENLLQQIFSSAYLYQCLGDRKNIYENVLNLCRIINMVPENVTVPISKEFQKQLSIAVADYPFPNTVCHQPLKRLMKRRVKAEVVSNKNILINFLILLNEKNEPRSILQDQARKLKYFIVRSYVKKIAVLDVSTAMHFKPANVLAASVQADIKILTAEGFEVVHLLEDQIHSSDEEITTIVKRALIQAGISEEWFDKAQTKASHKIKPTKDYSLDLPEAKQPWQLAKPSTNNARRTDGCRIERKST